MLLQDLVAESLQQGTYLAFDVGYSTPTMLELRTYTGQRGAYHGRASAQPVVISRERHTLEEPELIEDHEAEFNYVYAGGQDTKAARVVKTANTADALGLNRREKWIDARQSSTEAAVQSEANAALSANRYRRTLTGRIVDTDGCMDGVNYRYGDLLYAEYRGQGFDAHYNALSVIVENGTETRTTQIRGEA